MAVLATSERDNKLPLEDVLRQITPKCRKFAEEYIIDFDIRAAAVRMGIDQGHAHRYGSNYMADELTKRYVEILLDQQTDNAKLMANRVIIELARVAFGDVTNFVTWENGVMILKDAKSLQRAVTATIQDVGVGYGGRVKLKAYDKMQALELLMKHLGMINPRASEATDSALDGLIATIQASRLQVQNEVIIDAEGTVEAIVADKSTNLFVEDSDEV